MKALKIVSVMALLLAASLQAQENLKISYFQGGSFKIRFNFQSALFSGVGLRSEGMAGVLTARGADPATIVRHPAALALVKQPMMVFDVTPPLQFNAGSLMDLDPSIQSGVNSALADYNVPQNEITYPQLDINFGQAGVTGSGGAIIPTPYGYVGFAVYRPFNLSMDVFGNGFATMIETIKSIGENVTVVQFATQINPTVRLNLNTTAAGISYAKRIGEHFAFGATVDWLSARFDLNAFFKLDGIMLLRQEGAVAGQEYAFNDPYDGSIRWQDGEQNTLDQWAVGSYQGAAWGATFSALWAPGQTWSFDLAISLPPYLEMKGGMEFIQNRIPALQAENLINSGGNADIFDVTSLNLAKPTLTERFENPTDSVLVLSFPKSITFGISKKLGQRSLIALNFTQFMGEFAYNYLQYRHGLKFKQGFRMGMTFPMAWFLSPETIVLRLLGQDPKPMFRFGFGVTFMDEVKSGFKYQNNANRTYAASGLMLPSFAMGKSFWLFRNVETDILFIALPASLMKFSFLYRF